MNLTTAVLTLLKPVNRDLHQKFDLVIKVILAEFVFPYAFENCLVTKSSRGNVAGGVGLGGWGSRGALHVFPAFFFIFFLASQASFSTMTEKEGCELILKSW